MTRTASCCCGAASIAVEGEPDINGVCHCTDCKRRTGSAFGWQVYFPDAAVVGKTGAFACYQVGDPPRQQRHFCQACGTTLWWKSNFLPGHTGIAAGAFGETPLPEPSLRVTEEKRCAWVGLPEDWSRTLSLPA
jgi:hypothetical protein